MYSLIPHGKKKELSNVIGNDVTGIQATLEEVRFNVYKQDFTKALSLIEALIDKVEIGYMFEDDQVSEYHVFREFFQEILYRQIYMPSKELRHAELPYPEIYLQYGRLLFEMKQYNQAQEALEKALRWNPVDAQINFEYSSCKEID